MHLVSYLGYLIGVYGSSCNYVIRSSDTDYDNIVKYWKEREKINVKRVGKLTTKPIAKAPIQAAPTKKAPEKAEPIQPEKSTIKLPISPATNPTESKLAESKQATVLPTPSPSNTELNNSILKAVVQAGYSTQEAGKAASVVCREGKKDNFPQSLHSELQKVFPNENIKNLYAAVKPVVTEFLESSTKGNKPTSAKQAEPTPDVSAATTPPDKENQSTTTKNSVASALRSKPIDWNDVIQRAVALAGYQGWIPSKVASIFCKYSKDEMCLQKVHEELQNVFPNHKNLYDVVRLAAEKQFVSQENATPIPLSTEPVPAQKTTASQNQVKQVTTAPNKGNNPALESSAPQTGKMAETAVQIGIKRAPSDLNKTLIEGYKDVIDDVDKIINDCYGKDDCLNLLREKLRQLRPFSSLFRIVLPIVWEGPTTNRITDFYGPPRTEAKVRSLENRVRSILSDNGFDEEPIAIAVELSKRYFDNTNCHWLLRNSLKQELGAKGKEAYNLLKGLF